MLLKHVCVRHTDLETPIRVFWRNHRDWTRSRDALNSVWRFIIQGVFFILTKYFFQITRPPGNAAHSTGFKLAPEILRIFLVTMVMVSEIPNEFLWWSVWIFYGIWDTYWAFIMAWNFDSKLIKFPKLLEENLNIWLHRFMTQIFKPL